MTDTVQPTDSEREIASEIISHWSTDGPGFFRAAIAQALADQRARYEAVADELDRKARWLPTKHFSEANAVRSETAERIRGVSR